MKLFLALTLAVAVVNAGMGFEEDFKEMSIKKWSAFKAMESCVGAEVSDMFIAKKKAAIATCFGKPTPELAFPMFNSAFQTASALASAGMSKMEDSMDEPSMEQMFKKYLFEKAFKDMMDNDQQQMSGMKFFKSRFQDRFSRDAEEMKDMKDTKEVAPASDMKEAALAEKLFEKLKAEKKIMEALAGNFTCMAQQCGTLGEDGKFAPLAKILEKFEAVPLADAKLKALFLKDAEICYKVAAALPEEVLTECSFGPELTKVNHFKKCLKDRKLKTCMDVDMANRIKKNFGPMEKLEEQTQLKEKELIPLIRKLLHGEDM